MISKGPNCLTRPASAWLPLSPANCGHLPWSLCVHHQYKLYVATLKGHDFMGGGGGGVGAGVGPGAKVGAAVVVTPPPPPPAQPLSITTSAPSATPMRSARSIS